MELLGETDKRDSRQVSTVLNEVEGTKEISALH